MKMGHIYFSNAKLLREFGYSWPGARKIQANRDELSTRGDRSSVGYEGGHETEMLPHSLVLLDREEQNP
jgi:hypothetical protein